VAVVSALLPASLAVAVSLLVVAVAAESSQPRVSRAVRTRAGRTGAGKNEGLDMGILL
jgi:hypothetical protein